ncbi:ABC transporter ATP-binding protein [Microbacterium aurugineum]|uniref:ABC transporter ATP-binding protein n=1 Tax=Microbacterium aurugineum TaxID=2851642 RepID=UPI0020C0B749|nr:ABC transporter ATP-binding protein [Microbacterium aurugineum]MCK8478315.1 ABC transporter ATP-binding protein [Microbacterium aurugineum]
MSNTSVTASAVADAHGADAVRPGASKGITMLGLEKKYGSTAVVRSIDLDIRPGEFMTFLGPSGSGKTTTLNMIAGFTSSTSGRLEIDGRSVANVPPHKRDIGMVFQSYALFPHMSVSANIEFPLRRRRIPKAKRASMVHDALEMVRMTEYKDRLPSELSGGQQQRIALARALVYQPQVLLMDEPLGALDKKLRDWLQSEIKRIHQEVGSTFVYVTHDQEEALSLSDRIAVFNNGIIEQVGTGEELYERPQTLFVGTFLGESTVFRGTVASREGDRVEVQSGSARLRARGTVPGDEVAILVRPENLQLLPASPERSAPSTGDGVAVTVLSATYLGSAWRHTVRLPDGSTGLVRGPRSSESLEAGDPAWLEWNTADAVLLPAD